MSLSLNFHNAHFTQSAPSLAECPFDEGAEVAFAGRSNAGKSSAINTLTQQTKLARTSKTPGRTQLINFFAVDDHRRLVDLPGYGYAKVPIEKKKQWQKHLFNYLQERECLKGLVLLMDIRHPMQEYDTTMLNWAVDVDMPVHILLTKSDKLKAGPAKSTQLKLEEQLRQSKVDDLVTVQLFSSLKKSGLERLKQQLNSWMELAELPNNTVINPDEEQQNEQESNKLSDDASQ